MTKSISSLFLAFVLLVGVSSITVDPATGAATEKAADTGALLSLGKVGPDAIKLKVWTDPPADKPARLGQRIVIHFRADADCYLVVANISPKGVIIVFPNRERPDNRIEAGKEYTLFGTGSKLKLVLGRGVSEAKMAFYLSPQPIDLSPLKIGAKKAAIVIPSSASEKLKALKDKIEGISKQKGFNRKVLAIKSQEEGRSGLRLMGLPSRKGVRSRKSSDRPGSVTGTRGRAGDINNLKKAE